MGALTQFYTGAQLIPHLPRSSIGLRDSIAVDLSLVKNNTPLGILQNTEAHLEVVSGNIGGKNIPDTELPKYLSIAPSSVIVGEK